MNRAKIDLRDPAFLADPAPTLARIRGEAALVEATLPLLGRIWLTTSDEAARRLLKDQRFVRDPKAAGGKPIEKRFWWLPGVIRPLTENIILKDGEDHRRIRALVDRAFARTAIDAKRPRLAAMADGLLDRLDPSGPVDILAAYARPLPLMAICELLGIPDDDRDKVARWIGPISKPTGIASMITALPGLWRVMHHFRSDFATVRRTGRPGLIRELVEAEEDGDRLSENELLSLVFTLFVAGHETTVYLISDAIHSICADLGLRDRLADPQALALAVEEFMRFWTPVLMTKANYATEDIEFEGVRLRKGDQVAALLIAANHDPARHAEPEALIPDRRPNAHLGFGHGIHVCLGMQLARAETQVALERLLARFPGIALADPGARPGFNRRLGLRGFKRLDVRLRP